MDEESEFFKEYEENEKILEHSNKKLSVNIPKVSDEILKSLKELQNIDKLSTINIIIIGSKKTMINFISRMKTLFLNNNTNFLLDHFSLISKDKIFYCSELENSEVKLFSNDSLSTLTPNIISNFLPQNSLKNNKKKQIFNDQNEDEDIFKNYQKRLILNPSITMLDLSNNDLGSNEQNIKILKYILLNNNTITSLKLGNNKLGDNKKNFQLLKEGLMGNKSIQELDLTNNSLGEYKRNMINLKEALENNCSVKILNLGKNYLANSSNNMKYLSEILMNNICIRKLDLSRNCLGSNFDKIHYLERGLENNNYLTSLDLSDNDIGNDKKVLESILKAIEKNKNLKILNISGNNLDNKKENILFLKNYIKNYKYLVSIDISNNMDSINNNFMESLKDGLKLNNSFSEIELSYINMGMKELKIHSQRLSGNNNISSLNLEINDQEILNNFEKKLVCEEKFKKNVDDTNLDIEKNPEISYLSEEDESRDYGIINCLDNISLLCSDKKETFILDELNESCNLQQFELYRKYNSLSNFVDESHKNSFRFDYLSKRNISDNFENSKDNSKNEFSICESLFSECVLNIEF
jgi:hypothetical protein